MPSTQLGPRSWDAVLLMQYPSRASYDQAAKSAGYREALAAFEQTYSHGMRRNWLVNLGVHQGTRTGVDTSGGVIGTASEPSGPSIGPQRDAVPGSSQS